MEQSKLPSAHDKFFHFALSHLPVARGLIEMRLPLEVQLAIDLDTLGIESGSYIDADLREKHSDLPLSARLAESVEPVEADVQIRRNRNEVLVYVLFEHKSESDPLTVLQLLSYIVRIWERRVRDGLPLCTIIPIVVYHGASRWSAAQRLEDLVLVPESMKDFQVRFGFQLLDLSQLPDDQIIGDPLLQSTLCLLKYSRSTRLASELRHILELVAASTEATLQAFWIRAIGVYVMAVNKNIDSKEMEYIVSDVFPTLIEPGSLAHRLLIQGREEGLEAGWLACKIQTLQELLGDRQSTNEELRALNVEQLKGIVAELQTRVRKRDQQGENLP